MRRVGGIGTRLRCFSRWRAPLPAPSATKPAEGGVHLLEWLSELAGTALLVLGGLSAIALNLAPGTAVADVLPSHSARLLLTGAMFAGSASLVAISPIGRRSGAHLNPAVTVGFRLLGKVHRHDLAGYVAAQLVGGLAGAASWRLIWGSTAQRVGNGVTQPAHVTALAGAGIEMAMTATLVLTIFACVSSMRIARFTPLAVWVLVALLVWRVSRYTGTSLNPARSLGPATVAGTFRALWVYFAGPLAGAGLAVALWRTAMRERDVLTTKLFHDPRYPSTMATSLPAASAAAPKEGDRDRGAQPGARRRPGTP